MNAIEFSTNVSAEGTLVIPAGLLDQVCPD